MASCDPITGGVGCSRVYVSSELPACQANASITCSVANTMQNATLSLAEQAAADGGGWGMWVSIFCDVGISFGLMLQKLAHKRIIALEKAGQEARLMCQPFMMMGLLLMIGGEVGNLAAYGDRATPAAVITAVGCVGVPTNLIIATIFLKEPFRVRDVIGCFFVVGATTRGSPDRPGRFSPSLPGRPTRPKRLLTRSCPVVLCHALQAV